ncbi:MULTISPECIES: hypothetical protein [unclassified Paenibacillus]|uniref:hypothetical protein n=1 Tax=unclassified Paenibacillus TaxID=185978 RepID=UPI0031197F4F
MNISETVFAEYFRALNYEPYRYTKQEMRLSKTPDLKIFIEGILSMYCEVKEINEDERQDDIQHDNTYNIVSDCIYGSSKQFLAVNPAHNQPNILAIYSRRTGTDIQDFKITYEGVLETEKGERWPFLKNVSEGRIKKMKTEIDLCIWYDEFEETFKKCFCSDSPHYNRLKLFFPDKNI